MKIDYTKITIVLEQRQITQKEYDELKRIFPNDEIKASEHWISEAKLKR